MHNTYNSENLKVLFVLELSLILLVVPSNITFQPTIISYKARYRKPSVYFVNQNIYIFNLFRFIGLCIRPKYGLFLRYSGKLKIAISINAVFENLKI